MAPRTEHMTVYLNGDLERCKNGFVTGFPLTLENQEKWEKFFQSGKSQRILEFHQKVREKSWNFLSVREKSGKIRSENNIIILWGKSKNSFFQT